MPLFCIVDSIMNLSLETMNKLINSYDFPCLGIKGIPVLAIGIKQLTFLLNSKGVYPLMLTKSNNNYLNWDNSVVSRVSIPHTHYPYDQALLLCTNQNFYMSFCWKWTRHPVRMSSDICMRWSWDRHTMFWIFICMESCSAILIYSTPSVGCFQLSCHLLNKSPLLTPLILSTQARTYIHLYPALELEPWDQKPHFWRRKKWGRLLHWQLLSISNYQKQ